MWFVCIARSEDLSGIPQENLAGRIFIVSDNKRWRKEASAILKNAQKTMRKRDLSAEDFSGKDLSLLANTATEIATVSSFWVEFCMHRNGETNIRLDTAAQFYANATHIAASADKNHFHDLLCRQTFYFPKDICHRHQHHSPKTDTLADLYVSSNDIAWRREVLYALYRKIIHFKRNRTEDAVFDSKDMLAYAQAFQSICRKSGQHHQLPDFDGHSLECSLEAAHKDLTHKRETRRDHRSLFLGFVFSTLGIFLTIISLLQITDAEIKAPNQSLVAIATTFLQYPITFLVLFSAGALLLWCHPWYSPVFIDVARFLQPLGQFWAAFVCFVFALSFGTILLALLLI
ncbi:membrane hypothetical protein [uncultured Defluviicoccus sp.]|uniref:Uncharacterized protein n=1 Tax=metagenome TaxID=256318 RepID=A0A380TJJ4_9ZZZZ|nr:membrane hypothetical protein [uncultured Defluviicoccus sp.]